jgi:uncharacterized membrane protein
VTGTLAALTFAQLAFVGGHMLLAGTRLRNALARWLGERNFRIAFSSYSAVTLIWAILAYRHAPYVELWADTRLLGAVPFAVMPFAAILVVCGLATPNATSLGGARANELQDPVPGIMKVTRHPFLWGVVLWALAHVAANGDAASLILFAGMAALALGGMPSVDAKAAARLGAGWGPVVMRSSILPFAAILSGRTRVSLAEIGWLRILGGLALYAGLLFVHPWIAGKPAVVF